MTVHSRPINFGFVWNQSRLHNSVGATGEKELLSRLQQLPNFRYDVIVNAAGLTSNDLLICWERQ